MTKYQMTPIDNGTRIRDQPNTGGDVLTSVNADVVVTGTKLFVATVELRKPDGLLYQMIDDKWVEVTYNGLTGWMAYIHMGKPICDNFKVLDDEPIPDPDPVSVFPNSFTLINDETGESQKYVKVQE